MEGLNLLNASKTGIVARTPDPKNLPPGAILLTDTQVLEYRTSVIKNWKPRSEVWPFTYGHAVLAALSGFGGMYMNNHYRRALKLKHFARMSTYLPSVVFPSATSAIFHYGFVTTNILLEKVHCSVCVETRSLGLQLIAGGFYPLLIAPAAVFSFADRYMTYAIPPLKTNFGDVFNLWKTITMRCMPQFSAYMLLQALLTLYITREEMRVVFDVLNKHENQDLNFD